MSDEETKDEETTGETVVGETGLENFEQEPIGADALGSVTPSSAPAAAAQSGVPLAEDRAAGRTPHDDTGGKPPVQPGAPEVAGQGGGEQ